MALTENESRLFEMRTNSQLQFRVTQLEEKLNYLINFIEGQFGIQFVFENEVPLTNTNVCKNEMTDKNMELTELSGIQNVENGAGLDRSKGTGVIEEDCVLDLGMGTQSIKSNDQEKQLMNDSRDMLEEIKFFNSLIQSNPVTPHELEVSLPTVEVITSTKPDVSTDTAPDLEEVKPINKSFSCSWGSCGKLFSSRSGVRKHERTHLGEKPFICTWTNCGKRFVKNSTLTVHRRAHTGERPFVCEWSNCGKGFSSKPAAINHRRVHTGEKPFICKWTNCGRQFASHSNLATHTKVHTGEKPFVCDWPNCGKRFYFAYLATTHKRSHTGEKPFACDWTNCGKQFTVRCALSAHKRYHTDEKPVVCDWADCGKRFTVNSALTKHRRSHTGENSGKR